jgi:hypothetical protein
VELVVRGCALVELVQRVGVTHAMQPREVRAPIDVLSRALVTLAGRQSLAACCLVVLAGWCIRAG